MPIKEKKRKPVNKPEKFIEHLNLLNLLPNNLDDFLRKLSKLAEKERNSAERLSKIRAENAKRIRKGLETLNFSPEKRELIFCSYRKNIERLYAEFLETLSPVLKSYIKENCYDWRFGERKLNMLAVERQSIETIILRRKSWNEFQRDFQEWKQDKITDFTDRNIYPLLPNPMFAPSGNNKPELTDKQLYENFCYLMKHNPATTERFDAKKYEYALPEVNLILQQPDINEALHYERGTAGIKRKGFAGFYTRLAADGDFLGIAADGLIGIVLNQKLNGDAPIELDRLRRCEFCSKFLYAYKGNQIFCSTTCYNAGYQQTQRKGKIGLLKRQLKKAKVRLENAEKGLDSNPNFIKEQTQVVKSLEIEIEREAVNGNL
jgi:hypothetical protein